MRADTLAGTEPKRVVQPSGTKHRQASSIMAVKARPVSQIAFFLLVYTSAALAQAPACPGESSIFIARGWFEAGPGVRYQLTNFQARLVPKSAHAPLCYGRTTLVSTAQIFVTSESLTEVFGRKLKASSSKIKDFAVHHDASGATLTGTITKVIPIRFSISGPVTTDGTVIRLYREECQSGWHTGEGAAQTCRSGDGRPASAQKP